MIGVLVGSVIGTYGVLAATGLAPNPFWKRSRLIGWCSIDTERDSVFRFLRRHYVLSFDSGRIYFSESGSFWHRVDGGRFDPVEGISRRAKELESHKERINAGLAHHLKDDTLTVRVQVEAMPESAVEAT